MNVFNLNLSIDIIILIAIALIVLCGVLLGHSKVKTFALSVYVGIVLASELGQTIYGFMANKGLTLGGSLTLGQVRIALLIVPILILELGRTQHYKRGPRGSFIMTLVLSVLVASLIISSVINALEPDSLKRILEQSNLAWPLFHFRLWWVAAVPIAVLLESFSKSRDH